MSVPKMTKKAKAWGAPAISEPRWPASIAILVACAISYYLPAQYTLGPQWMFPAIALAILIPLSIAAPHRVASESRAIQTAAIALIGVLMLSNIASLVRLIHVLIFEPKNVVGSTLLISAAGIWLTNVIVFALWYWELDRGGPDERLEAVHQSPDFLFPQMSTPGCAEPGWSPAFVDYLYIAFTNATAFSPTDTLPLSRWAKVLMLIQSTASLLTVTLVAARAVNILT
jgi:uncharacterized membrane protein